MDATEDAASRRPARPGGTRLRFETSSKSRRARGRRHGRRRGAEQALRHLGSAEGTTVLLAGVTIGAVVVMARLAPLVPGALAAVVIGIAGQLIFDLQKHGVALVGHIPSGLPSLDVPTFAHTADLLPAALGIALMAAIESNSAARAFARPDEPQVNANREWSALGAANLGVAVVQGFPAGGGTSQTAVNAKAGAHSRASGIVTAVVVALALTLLASLFSKMPEATLGAIVLVAAAGLVKPPEFRRISQIRPRDGALALVALVSVLLLGPLKGILAAVVLSMLTLLHEANLPRLSVLRREPGLVLIKSEGGIYFANADRLYDALLGLTAAEDGLRVLVVDASAVPDLEYTGLEMLERLRRELAGREIDLWLAALNPRPRAMVEGSTLGAPLFATPDEAVAAYHSDETSDAQEAP